MTVDDLDLVEINEAFAAQVIPSHGELGIDLDRLNVHGGGRSRSGAPLLALTFFHASHTSVFEISNGLPDNFSSSTQLLPDQRPVDRTNTPRMT
jgi:hypothetical protein